MKSQPRNKKASTAGNMTLPPTLTPPKDATSNKKRSLSCSAQPRTRSKKGAARGAASGTLLSTPTLVEATSTKSSRSRTGKLLPQPQRKSVAVAEGCDTPKHPPIVVYGRDINLDKKCHGNQTLLKLIHLNLTSYMKESNSDVRAVLVRKIIQQIRDWQGRFVKLKKGKKAWEDLPSDDTIALVRGTFDEEVLKRRAETDAAILRFHPKETAIQKILPRKIDSIHMDKDQMKAYVQLTPVQRAKFRKLCQLGIDDIEDAVNLLEIPPWPPHKAVVSPTVALSFGTLQNETVGRNKLTESIPPWTTHTAVVSPTVALSPGTLQNETAEEKKLTESIPPWTTHTAVVSPTVALSPGTLQNGSAEEKKLTESCSWVDALMLATQGSEESLLSRSTTFDDNTPLSHPISSRRHIGADNAGLLPESDSQQASVQKAKSPVQKAKFTKLCQLQRDKVMDAITLIEIPPWTHRVIISPIAALSPETLQNENGGGKRRKKSRNKSGHVPDSRQGAHWVSCKPSGDWRIRTESCSWVDALMLATQDSEECLLSRSSTFDDNTPLLLDLTSSCRHLWGEDMGLPESDTSQVPVLEVDMNLYESPFLW